MVQKLIILLSFLLLTACGHQDGVTGPSSQPTTVQQPDWASSPPAESSDTTGVPACPEHMHEVVTSIWGMKSCVNDEVLADPNTDDESDNQQTVFNGWGI